MIELCGATSFAAFFATPWPFYSFATVAMDGYLQRTDVWTVLSCVVFIIDLIVFAFYSAALAYGWESHYFTAWIVLLSICMESDMKIHSIFQIYVRSKCRFHCRKCHLHKPIRQDLEKFGLPGVSIAKPLCSKTDQNLAENLKTYFELDYPTVSTIRS